MVLNFNELFKKNNGRVVKLQGIAYKIRYRETNAIYPYKHKSVSIDLDPVNKRSEYYLKIKRKLGDDWSTDAKSLSDASLTEIYPQLK